MKQKLQELLEKLIAARNDLSGTVKPPLLLKLAPDLTQEQRKDIADVLRDKKVRNVRELCAGTCSSNHYIFFLLCSSPFV
jgi:dihydroorotate dehydrogenase